MLSQTGSRSLLAQTGRLLVYMLFILPKGDAHETSYCCCLYLD